MTINIQSLHGRLLNIAKEKKTDLQMLINRLGAEQFLYRLSLSPYADKFIFKGGSLLTYLIESDRKTKDLDFSIKQLNNQVDEMMMVVQSVLDISVDDIIEWKLPKGEPLNHPEMEHPGVRINCDFLLGKMKGIVRMDLALGDVVDAVLTPIPRMQYRGRTIFEEAFSLKAYPAETVFAEKLQISLKKGGRNTRMKDYYDLLKLMSHELDSKKLKQTIQEVFANRRMELSTRIQFEEIDLARLQVYWEHFLKRENMSEIPTQLKEIIDQLNDYLGKLYDR